LIKHLSKKKKKNSTIIIIFNKQTFIKIERIDNNEIVKIKGVRNNNSVGVSIKHFYDGAYRMLKIIKV